MADFLPGYRTVATLGQGARSLLYQVVDSGGKPYALKRVVRRDNDDTRFIEQVETEYAVSHGIQHPNLRHSLAIHRVRKWMQTREVVLLMEYVSGQTLELQRPGRLDDFLTVFRKVAQGLAALHKHGYVHADIKPNNIVVGPEGVVKIIDFGQSCPIGHKKERIQGTPDYIAPEQVRRINLDQRTDVYNLGATMYWVLTGMKFPTAIPELHSKVEVVKVDKPPTPRELNGRIPLALSQLIMDCCKANPLERPADMGQVESRLKVVQNLWRTKQEEARAARGDAGAAAVPVDDPLFEPDASGSDTSTGNAS